MSFRASAIIVASVVLFLSSAHAEPFKPKINAPQSYTELLQGIDELRTNMETVACGGWADPSTGAVSGNPPQIVVTGDVPLARNFDGGLPGRSVKSVLGDAADGIGIRGPFQFPGSAFGFLSACDMNAREIVDDDLKALGIPGIRWQWSGNPDDQVSFVSDPGAPGVIEINPYRWCLPIDGATPRLCEKLFQTLQALSRSAPRPPINAAPAMPSPRCICPPDALACPPARVEKHYCFDETTASQPTVTAPCNGEQCRTPDPPYFTNQLLRCEWGVPQFDADGNYLGQLPKSVEGDWEDVTTTSFYRHYGGAFTDWRQITRPTGSNIEVESEDKATSWKIRAECYGQYQEIDPRETVLSPGAEQCEIAILTPDEQMPDPPEWKGEQRGETEASLSEPPLPMPPTLPGWLSDQDTGLTLPRIVHTSSSVGNASDLLAKAASTFGVTRQLSSATIPPFGRTDTFSDDAERAFGAWWEEEQRELLRRTRDPAIRLLLPPRALTGFDETDPLYRFVHGMIKRPDGIVEAQLRQGDDDIVTTLTSLMSAWIAPISPVDIPVIVPKADIESLDATIIAWESWQKKEEADALLGKRASFAQDAAPILLRLNEYRTRLLEVRTLRTSLPLALSGALQLHADIRSAVGQWYEQNATQLLANATQSIQRRQLMAAWKEVQDRLLSTDASQLLWCSNQRYTLPLYSLLDLPGIWWGDRAPGSLRNAAFSPPRLSSLPYSEPPDLLFDFSDMRVNPSPLPLPVLSLEEIPVHLPVPPPLGDAPIDITALPPLPPLPDPRLPSAPRLPQVIPPAQHAVIPPPLPADDLSTSIAMMQDVSRRIDAMSASYERLQPSVLVPPDPTQTKGDARRIIHVENELRERVLRLFARWMPERRVDYAGRAARLREGVTSTCHEDTVCSLLPPTIVSTAVFQWFVPGRTNDFAPLSQNLAPAFLQTGDEKQNPFTLPIPSLLRLLPSLPLPSPSPLLLPSSP